MGFYSLNITILTFFIYYNSQKRTLKGIVSPDWKGLQMVSLDRFEV
jgi:hypothetical protein